MSNSKELDFNYWKDKWKNLIFSGKLQQAEKIYWKKMFPSIEKRFVTQTQKRIKKGEIKEYDLLIIPMGLESSYYILLINGLKPKQVYFLATREGERYFLDEVIKRTGLEQSQYRKDIIEYAGMDASEVYRKIKRRLGMFKGKRIAVDLSRGKRVMSAGAAIVGDFFGCDMIYIDEGWIDEIKRGDPGTEKLVVVKNPLHIFGELEQMHAVELFNRYEFSAAAKLFDRLQTSVPDPRPLEIKTLISQAYAFWESLDYKVAFHILAKAFQKIEQYDVRDIDIGRLKMNLDALGVLQKEQTNTKLLDSLKNNEFVVHLLVDIFSNAVRRSKQGRYEDAIQRLYRALELISQHRLAKLEIDTADPDFEKLKKYLSQYKKITKEVYGEEKNFPEKIPLMDGHLILFAMNDDLWKSKDIKELKDLLQVIRIRDNSIVAHGLSLVTQKTYEKFKNKIEPMLARLCKFYGFDFDEIKESHRINRLKK